MDAGQAPRNRGQRALQQRNARRANQHFMARTSDVINSIARNSPARLALIVFALIIIIFTILLELPAATTFGRSAPLVDAFFTATSAVCVTGLVTVDTALYWSGFGQFIIMIGMAIGGLGVMTLASILGMAVSRRIGLTQKFLAANEKAKEWNSWRVTGGGWKENTPATDSREESNLPPPSTLNPPPKTLFLKVDGEYRQIAISDIIYVSGMKDYVMFYLESERRPLVTYLRMKAVEEMLPPQQFMRVHRSYIVALEKIRKVDRNDCIYIGDEIIHVTEAYLPAFQQYLNSKFPGK